MRGRATLDPQRSSVLLAGGQNRQPSSGNFGQNLAKRVWAKSKWMPDDRPVG
jgi:hypothetical protein